MPELAFTDIALTPSRNLRVEWASVVGSIYRMEMRTNLLQGVWIDDFADDISATKETMSWTNALDRMRFYRIKAVE